MNKAAYTISAEIKNTLGLHVGATYESKITSLANSPSKTDKNKAKTTDKTEEKPASRGTLKQQAVKHKEGLAVEAM